jgi:dTDP-4-amino-4,6-dideoxygalactose transaminase
LGARPVFVDIDSATFNLSPPALAHYLENVGRRDAAGVLRVPTGERLRAIVPVHLFGLCCAMDEIVRMGREFGLDVLEDASQALGAEYESRAAASAVWRAGTMGEMGWFSFFPSKNLGAFGDGGMTVARDPSMLRKLRALRMHGMEDQYIHRMIGGNFRLDALQAAVLSVKLPHLDAWSSARRANAGWYRHAFEKAGLLEKVTPPAEPWADTRAGQHHIYHQYVVRVAAAERDALRAHLAASGIGNAVYYPLALHEQECFRSLGYAAGDFPVAEAAARESLALPVFPELTRAEQERVVSVIAGFYS